QLFSWVGLYPGGMPVVTQSAWGAAFGTHSLDPDLVDAFPVAKDATDGLRASWLTIFYLLLFLPNIVLTVGVLVQHSRPINLPPHVKQFLPWRWGIVAAANALVFLFLLLQLLFGFSLESIYTERVEKAHTTTAQKTTQAQKVEDMRVGQELNALRRTLA